MEEPANHRTPYGVPVRPQGRIPVIARLVWADAGEEWLPAHAVRWTADRVMVVWGGDGGGRDMCAWLPLGDVRRSIRFGRAGVDGPGRASPAPSASASASAAC